MQKIKSKGDADTDDPSTWRQVPALHVRGCWAVTPSDDSSSPGFAVTHQATGMKAWPMRPGAVTLGQARTMAEKFYTVWTGEKVSMPAEVFNELRDLAWGSP